jgi:predicted ATPase
MKGALKNMSIHGFKSLRSIEDFEMRDLNIFIGANGAGKSNLVQLFKMLREMTQKNFAGFILENGGAGNFLYNGRKTTEKITCEFDFHSHSMNSEGPNSYRFELKPNVEDSFLISEERKYVTSKWRSYGSPSSESRLADEKNELNMTGDFNGIGHFVFESISHWMVYHFHDTSAMAPMRNYEIVEDNNNLRSHGSNIAPFLLHLKESAFGKSFYNDILNAVRMVIPFFR